MLFTTTLGYLFTANHLVLYLVTRYANSFLVFFLIPAKLNTIFHMKSLLCSLLIKFEVLQSFLLTSLSPKPIQNGFHLRIFVCRAKCFYHFFRLFFYLKHSFYLLSGKPFTSSFRIYLFQGGKYKSKLHLIRDAMFCFFICPGESSNVYHPLICSKDG